MLGAERAATLAGLLERDELLAALKARADDACAGTGRLVLLAGDAGIGKTALVRAFAGQARGVRVLWGGCDPLSTPAPLAPFVDMALAAGDGLRAALAERTARAVFTSLQTDVLARPTLMIIEDAHWADEATLDVLRLVGRRVTSMPVLVVVTFREVGVTDPLRVALGDFAGAPGVARMRVEPLSAGAIATLAAGTGADARELHRRTGGNAFYATEVLAASGSAVPASVRDAVLARMARLDVAVRSVLQMIASSPAGAEGWLIRATLGEAADAVAAGVTAGFLEDRGGVIAVRHEIAREAVETAIAPLERRHLHRRLLAALLSAPHPVDPARLAHHAEAACDADAACEYGQAAARRAAAAGAHREAAAQYGRALRFGSRLPAARRARLHEARAEALYAADEQVASIADLEAAIALHREGADLGGEADATSRLVPRLLCRGRLEDARGAAEQAVELLAGTGARPELAGALAALAHVRLADADLDVAIAIGQQATAIATEFDDLEVAVDAAVTTGTAAFLQGGTAHAETLERALLLARERGVESQVPRALLNLAAAANAHRAHAQAKRWIDEGLSYADGNDLVLWRLAFLGTRVSLELNEGRWQQATTTADLVAADLRDSPEPRTEAELVRALVRARRGDPGADAALAAAAGSQPGEGVGALRIATARAEMDWLGGRADAIGASTDHVVDLAARSMIAWRRGELAVWRHRAGCAIPHGPLPEPVALEVEGRVMEAAAAWERLGCPYEAAVCLCFASTSSAIAEAYQRLRSMDAGPAAAFAARQLRERGVRGIARGPRPSTRRNPANLTTRELDVLALIAEGLANAEIADRLFLSRRTIDHHVSSILRKLDVATRARAVAKAAAQGIGSPRV